MKSAFQKLQDHFSSLTVERKYAEFGIFLLIALFFWVLNALNKTYSTDISLPVRYVNIPEDKQLTNELPKSFDVIVEGHGFDLLKQKFGIHIFPYKIDVPTHLKKVKTQNSIETYAIVSRNLIQEVEANLDGEFKVESIFPDSIQFEFSPIQNKRVAIKSQVELSFASQHKLHSPLSLEPDSVTISGPQAILDSIDYILTEKLSLENLNLSTQRNLKLKAPDKIKLKVKRTVANIAVERFTEHSLQVPIAFFNNSVYNKIDLLKTHVTVRYIVGISDFNAIKTDDFKMTIRIDSKDSLPEHLPVILESFPASVSVLGFQPQTVDYIIKK